MAQYQGKVSDELYNKLEELKATTGGGTYAEFMDRMADAYQLSRLKYGESLLGSEVEELESLTSRINRLMVNANEKINSALADKEHAYAEKQATNEELISRLKQDIATLEEKNQEINEQLVEANNSNLAMVDKLVKLEEQEELSKALVTEYKIKNDTLAGTLTEYKQDREDNKTLQKANAELIEKVNELELENNRCMQKVSILETEKEDLLKKHEEVLALQKQLADVAVKEATANAKEQAQAKIENYMSKVEELRNTVNSLKEKIQKLSAEKK